LERVELRSVLGKGLSRSPTHQRVSAERPLLPNDVEGAIAPFADDYPDAFVARNCDLLGQLAVSGGLKVVEMPQDTLESPQSCVYLPAVTT